MNDTRARMFLVLGALQVGVGQGCSDPVGSTSGDAFSARIDSESTSNAGWYDGSATGSDVVDASDTSDANAFDVEVDADTGADIADTDDTASRMEDNVGWDDESNVDVDPTAEGLEPLDAADSTEVANEGPGGDECCDNSGWYSNDVVDDIDVPDAATVSDDVDGQATGDADVDEAAANPCAAPGLDWVALAWCAPERSPAGLRRYRRAPPPFVVARKPT